MGLDRAQRGLADGLIVSLGAVDGWTVPLGAGRSLTEVESKSSKDSGGLFENTGKKVNTTDELA